jgi:hypothetical protein
MTSSEGKRKLLGMPFGTAGARLRKSLLFDMAGRLGMLECFRCGFKIENIEDFSIEHKDPWQRSADPVSAFFDIRNIAYSHCSCNRLDSVSPLKKYTTVKERRHAEHVRMYSDPIKREITLARKRVS